MNLYNSNTPPSDYDPPHIVGQSTLQIPDYTPSFSMGMGSGTASITATSPNGGTFIMGGIPSPPSTGYKLVVSLVTADNQNTIVQPYTAGTLAGV